MSVELNLQRNEGTGMKSKKTKQPTAEERETFWGEVLIEEFLGCYSLPANPRTYKLLKEFAQRMPKKALQKLIDQNIAIWESNPIARAEHIECPIRFKCPYDEKKRGLNFVLLDSHSFNKLSAKAAIGVLAHEFAHIALKHRALSEQKIEGEADELASKWGFAEEIKLQEKEMKGE